LRVENQMRAPRRSRAIAERIIVMAWSFSVPLHRKGLIKPGKLMRLEKTIKMPIARPPTRGIRLKPLEKKRPEWYLMACREKHT
jgi:hypothetical protein